LRTPEGKFGFKFVKKGDQADLGRDLRKIGMPKYLKEVQCSSRGNWRILEIL
jgi:hypothetical protein